MSIATGVIYAVLGVAVVQLVIGIRGEVRQQRFKSRAYLMIAHRGLPSYGHVRCHGCEEELEGTADQIASFCRTHSETCANATVTSWIAFK